MEELNQDLKNCRLNMPKTFTKIKQKWQHGLFPIAKVTEKGESIVIISFV